MMQKIRGKPDRRPLRFAAGRLNRTAEKKRLFFGQPGGSAVLSMQGACACSCHDQAAPGGASPGSLVIVCDEVEMQSDEQYAALNTY